MWLSSGAWAEVICLTALKVNCTPLPLQQGDAAMSLAPLDPESEGRANPPVGHWTTSWSSHPAAQRSSSATPIRGLCSNTSASPLINMNGIVFWKVHHLVNTSCCDLKNFVLVFLHSEWLPCRRWTQPPTPQIGLDVGTDAATHTGKTWQHWWLTSWDFLVRTEQVHVSPKWQQRGSLVRFSFYYGQEAGLGENSYLLGWGRTERRVWGWSVVSA